MTTKVDENFELLRRAIAKEFASKHDDLLRAREVCSTLGEPTAVDKIDAAERVVWDLQARLEAEYQKIISGMGGWFTGWMSAKELKDMKPCDLPPPLFYVPEERASDDHDVESKRDVMELCRAAARAAIIALREPTEEMLSAGSRAMSGKPVMGQEKFGTLRDGYRAMIDAALGEE